MVRRHSGFSLIEMLVATTILMMVLSIATMAYGFFIERWQNSSERFDEAAGKARKLIMTREAIRRLMPYVLKLEGNRAGLYFEGNRDSLVGVTGRSMFSTDAIAAVRLRIEQGENFKYSLIYEEAIMSEAPLTSLEQELEFRHQTVVLSGMQQLELFFKGHKDLPGALNGSQQQWWETFNGLNRQLLPSIIRISFQREGEREHIDISLPQVDRRILSLFSDDSL